MFGLIWRFVSLGVCCFWSWFVVIWSFGFGLIVILGFWFGLACLWSVS